MGLHTPIEAHRVPHPFGVEILDLRHFSSSHVRPLLEHETQFWANRMSWDYRPSAEMILRYIDSKILPGYAVVDGGRVGGYAFFVYEGSKGVIGDLYADGSIRLPDDTVERRLAVHVIDTLQRSPGVRRIEAQLLPHDSGTLSPPFLAEGFRQFPRLFMVLPLNEPFTQQISPGPEIEFRRWAEHDFQPAAAVITTSYRGHVDSEINDQYRTLSGSLRFLNNIIRFPGCGTFDPESSFVAVDRETHSLAGIILCSRVRHDVGHVTQVCVLPDYRAHGLGKLLMAATIRNLKQRKFSTLSLTVTEANKRAVELYHHLGFETKRVFDAFVWEG